MRIYPNRTLLREPEAIPASGGGVVEKPVASTPSSAPVEKKVINDKIKPQMAKAVPDDVKKMTFSVDDFEVQQLPVHNATRVETEDKTGKKIAVGDEAPVVLEQVESGIVQPKKPKEEKAPVVEKPVAKKEEVSSILKPPASAAEKKADAPVAQPVVKGKEKIEAIGVPHGQRDYTGFSQEEAGVLKQMSNDGFLLASKLIKDNRELKKLEGTTYLQHEHAYVLDPEFQRTREDVTYAQKEAMYWRDQLVLMDAGKPWREVVKWDANGNPVLGPEQVTTKAAELDVTSRMHNCTSIAQQLNSKLGEYPSKYKSRVSEDLKAVESECKARFSWESDPKLMDYTLPIQYEDGTRDVSIKQIKSEFASMFPPYMRSHPAVNVAANLMVALRIGHAQMAATQNTQKVEEIKQEEVSLGEPTSEAKPSKQDNKKAVHGVKEFKLDPSIIS